MRSFIIRHWSGTLNAWLSLLVTLAVYLVATMVVIAIGSIFEGQLAFVLLIGFWLVSVVSTAIGTLRSAFRALRDGRTKPVSALGGIVAMLVLGLSAFFAALDLRGLLFGA